ncbi:hypothetical protein ABIB85_007915 [Bradyrhizobium sp. JR1.5]
MLGNVVASDVKVMVLAVIVGIGTGLLSQFTTAYGGGQPTIEQVLTVVLAALAMLGLGILRARHRNRSDVRGAAARRGRCAELASPSPGRRAIVAA